MRALYAGSGETAVDITTSYDLKIDEDAALIAMDTYGDGALVYVIIKVYRNATVARRLTVKVWLDVDDTIDVIYAEEVFDVTVADGKRFMLQVGPVFLGKLPGNVASDFRVSLHSDDAGDNSVATEVLIVAEGAADENGKTHAADLDKVLGTTPEKFSDVMPASPAAGSRDARILAAAQKNDMYGSGS